MNDVKLKSCPFCGSLSIQIHADPITNSDGQVYYVGCFSCDTDGPRYCNDKQEAIKLWNQAPRKKLSDEVCSAFVDRLRPFLPNSFLEDIEDCFLDGASPQNKSTSEYFYFLTFTRNHPYFGCSRTLTEGEILSGDPLFLATVAKEIVEVYIDYLRGKYDKWK